MSHKYDERINKRISDENDVLNKICLYLIEVMDDSQLEETELHVDIHVNDGRTFHLHVKRTDEEKPILKNKN